MPELQGAFITFNGQRHELKLGKITLFEELYVQFQIEETATYKRFQLSIHPKEKVVIDDLEITFQQDYSSASIYCNGFQSWTESREYELNEKIEDLRTLVKPVLGYYGDYGFEKIQRGAGLFHSWTYSYVRQNKTLSLIGSLSEFTGFTLIQHDSNSGSIKVSNDCAGLELEHSYPALDFVVIKGNEKSTFDRYFEQMNLPQNPSKPLVGWTSWYNYYNKISEAIILKNLKALKEGPYPAEILQIDDGYQEAIGDWAKIKKSFPNGMGHLAKTIQNEGLKAGLWLAPFICEKNSDIYRNKKSWLLKDKNGKPQRAGYTALWSGWFYALDFYNTEVQEYLANVFHLYTKEWGYDLLKLDFLYAVCINPPKHKTRGQVMHEAMEFISQNVGEAKVLACGVPLGSAFGKVAYCRIGADIHLKWEFPWMKWLGFRERVSTLVSLRTTLGRWHLNGKVFHNDPDVFILRKENNKLTPTQQHTVLLINVLMGNVLFNSDEVSTYDEEQLAELEGALQYRGAEIDSVHKIGKDLFAISFSKEDLKYCAYSNLNETNANVSKGNLNFELEACETLVLKR